MPMDYCFERPRKDGVSHVYRYTLDDGTIEEAVFYDPDELASHRDAVLACRAAGLPVPPRPRRRRSARDIPLVAPRLGEFYVETFEPTYLSRLSNHRQSKIKLHWNQHACAEPWGIAKYRLDRLANEPELWQTFFNHALLERGFKLSYVESLYWAMRPIFNVAWAMRRRLGFDAPENPFESGLISEPKYIQSPRRGWRPVAVERVIYELRVMPEISERERLEYATFVRCAQVLGGRLQDILVLMTEKLFEGGKPRSNAVLDRALKGPATDPKTGKTIRDAVPEIGPPKNNKTKHPPMARLLQQELIEYVDAYDLWPPETLLFESLMTPRAWEDFRDGPFLLARQRAAGHGSADTAVAGATITEIGRHTMVSMHMAARESIQQIADWIGDNAKTVAEHYSHIIPKYDKCDAISVDDALEQARREVWGEREARRAG